MDDDGAANLPAGAGNLVRPIQPGYRHNRPSASSSSSSSLSSSSPPRLLRHVQAAFKRHRPLGSLQSNVIRPKRVLMPQREVQSSLASNCGTRMDDKSLQDSNSLKQGHDAKDLVAYRVSKTTCVSGDTQEDVSVTPPSISSTLTNVNEDGSKHIDVDPVRSDLGKRDDKLPLSRVDSHCIPTVGAQKKVQPSPPNYRQGADDQMATGMDDLSSHLGSLALTEMEWEVSNPPNISTFISQDMKQQNLNTESENYVRSEGGVPSLLSKKITHIQDQLYHFKNFSQSDSSHPMTHCSLVGSSCATSTLIHSTCAPIPSSTTHCSQNLPDDSHTALECNGNFDVNRQLFNQGDVRQPSNPSSNNNSGVSIKQPETAVHAPASVLGAQKGHIPCNEQHGSELKEINLPRRPSPVAGKSTGRGYDLTDVQSQAPLSKTSTSDLKFEASKSVKPEKAAKGTSAPRKRGHDPEMFFKVNGKAYQKLGKIGSGGSSEVHKVISSDCTIYALKKIKLKGRDYATAYGFCQEINYLNKLKGKNYIIQLVDYEVTDKALLHEVMSGSLSNRDGRVRDDGYIYMVLEYGEIDLAHMLSQKWKELDSRDQRIDENWLRFYWQQILLAVNTIHEERIVHSDLKPANFLLVKGSLKLIDFGIAKAIMSDTTNIQRDSQVGTLSYMSPEAFMCNEVDTKGNIIKCGRPSDIWSLGCILYQMVYGRTPFSEYKTFWQKLKIITNPNHEIKYEPVSNPWLLDLMRNCLAWDRSERWRIPQLLQHPFLVPPIPPDLPSIPHQNYNLLQCVAETFEDDQEASTLYCQLKKLLTDPMLPTAAQPLKSRDKCCKLLSEMAKCCLQLQQHLANSSS